MTPGDEKPQALILNDTNTDPGWMIQTVGLFKQIDPGDVGCDSTLAAATALG